MNMKKLRMLALVGMLIVSSVLISGCIQYIMPEQLPIMEDITPKEAHALIQENRDNPDFVILDVRTPREVSRGFIENSINIDYRAEGFRDALNELDRDKIYLVYCKAGGRSAKALGVMNELGFREAYNMLGGATQWEAAGLPLIMPPPIMEDITAKEAHAMIQKYRYVPDFAILDVRTPGEFARGFIEGSINIDYRAEGFRDALNELDRDKIYLVYCKAGGRSASALGVMNELGFREAYNMLGGTTQWEADGLPLVLPIVEPDVPVEIEPGC